jgi:hypothetical protein
MSRKDAEWKNTDVERDRGILNERERRYLLTNGIRTELAEERGTTDEIRLTGEDAIEPGSARERQIRQQIRNHTMNAILDFSYLVGHLENRDKERIFNDGYDPSDTGENAEKSGKLMQVNHHISDLVMFIYQLYRLEYDETAIQEFEELIRRGLESTHLTEKRDATAKVDIDLQLGDSIDQLVTQYEEEGLKSLAEQEAHLLYEHREISRDEYIQWLKNSDV